MVDDDIKQFLKKLYLYYGMGHIPYMPETPFLDEYNKISNHESRFTLNRVLRDNEWVDDGLSRKFTEKFVKDIIKNE